MRLTVPASTLFRDTANASQATMVATSWMRILNSRALVVGFRSWESFAFMQGWLETCTLDGRGSEADVAMLAAGGGLVGGV